MDAAQGLRGQQHGRRSHRPGRRVGRGAAAGVPAEPDGDLDGAGFSHKLLEHLDKLASRRGHTLIYSCGRELDQREKAAIRLLPEHAWEIAIDHRGEVRERRAAALTRSPKTA